MKCLIHAIACCLALAVVAGPAFAQNAAAPAPDAAVAAPDAPAPLAPAADQPLQRVPARVLSAFGDAVRASELWQMADVLRLEPVQKQAGEWQKGVETPVRLVAFPFVKDLAKRSFSHEGKTYILTLDERVGQAGWVLRVDDALYRVMPEDLAPFQFQYVKTFTVVDPANEPRETIRFQETDLSKVAESLCLMGNMDLAIRLSVRDTPFLNLTLRHKTPAEALRFAAQAAGWTLTFQVAGQPAEGIDNWSIDSHRLLESYQSQRLEGAVTDENGVAVTNLLGFARLQVLQQARQMLNNRPVAVLQRPEWESSPRRGFGS